MKKAIVIINEAHLLMSEQERIIKNKFEDIEFLKVPASGWTLEEIQEKINCVDEKLSFYRNKTMNAVIFVSPIPAMIKLVLQNSILQDPECAYFKYSTLVFHNDNREKKELPDGRIIQVVAKTGWRLV